jgi:hypothetical protein
LGIKALFYKFNQLIKEHLSCRNQTGNQSKILKVESWLKYRVVDEPVFNGLCELCSKPVVEVVFKFEGPPGQHYAHRRCLEDDILVKRFTTQLREMEKRLEDGFSYS